MFFRTPSTFFHTHVNPSLSLQAKFKNNPSEWRRKLSPSP